MTNSAFTNGVAIALVLVTAWALLLPHAKRLLAWAIVRYIGFKG